MKGVRKRGKRHGYKVQWLPVQFYIFYPTFNMHNKIVKISWLIIIFIKSLCKFYRIILSRCILRYSLCTLRFFYLFRLWMVTNLSYYWDTYYEGKNYYYYYCCGVHLFLFDEFFVLEIFLLYVFCCLRVLRGVLLLLWFWFIRVVGLLRDYFGFWYDGWLLLMLLFVMVFCWILKNFDDFSFWCLC